MNKTFALDLETLGTRPGCVIATIGVVELDLARRSPSVSQFYRRITISSCLKAGLKIDAETLQWWLAQEPAAFREVFSHETDHRHDLEPALRELSDYLGPQPIIYGNGPTFDLGILTAAYEAVGLTVPWQYRHERCLRTEKAAILRQGGTWAKVTNPIPHHAGYDAVIEAQEFINALNSLDVPAPPPVEV